MWHKRELENYLCQRETLLDYAEAEGRGQQGDSNRQQGDLFSILWRGAMDESIAEIEAALVTLGEPSPWGPDIKASDAVLDRVFRLFYKRLELPNLMRKTDYYRLARFVSPTMLADPEIREKLDAIHAARAEARPVQSP